MLAKERSGVDESQRPELADHSAMGVAADDEAHVAPFEEVLQRFVHCDVVGGAVWEESDHVVIADPVAELERTGGGVQASRGR